MTSLRGRSLESIARLGGHSYLVWGTNLIPGPLKLPACFVAMILYLRKYGLWIFVTPLLPAPTGQN